jgi:hypothetical protein
VTDVPGLVVTFLGGGVIGSFAGGWLARWTEREKPLRDTMISATDEYVGAISAAISELIAVGQDSDRLRKAAEECNSALGCLGRLHVLFEEKTYGEAEQCCADLRAVIADQGVTANSLRKFESAYRHLRAFADCAGSEIRRPSGLSRKLGGPSARADHIKHQTGDTKPSSPILDELSKRFASTTGRTD